jgi:hypothetical protein
MRVLRKDHGRDTVAVVFGERAAETRSVAERAGRLRDRHPRALVTNIALQANCISRLPALSIGPVASSCRLHPPRDDRSPRDCITDPHFLLAVA